MLESSRDSATSRIERGRGDQAVDEQGLAPKVHPRERPLPAPRQRSGIPAREASAGMVARAVSVRSCDVVFVKGIVEASEGLASLFAERGGELVLASAPSRAAELDELLIDLAREVDARIGPDPFEPRIADEREASA